MFLACTGQLQLGPLGGIVGLRAEGVEAVFRMRGVPRKEQAALFGDLELMVGAAARVVNQAAAK